ncbi:hypothetical protein NAEGRDRAFT_56909 [Naegleria gruberi]|uniref:Autophagy-related protein 2 n=1 Tax=Naegleria gruberi TaxID=5762 RepID=D2V2D4_NAEGR|nr:uncharacterized protein NAEGRDRAFT_56909 [Naegleria gruberi]EFC48880.1 hypothetical protein NAEGRDRAFT_56909 [Naegleria gruberi]|eukprot:XP_002681624.1 hypothetical protein NAEGRDRAFT_56909 [Naegleria gruberi strain NEG-M]
MSGVGSWFIGGFSRLTDPIKKRIFKFVIKRLLGRFIEEPDLSQLDVQLPGSQTHRKASHISGQQTDQIASFDFELKNVQLKVKEINENILMHNSKLSQSSDKDGIPFILSSGYIEKICVKIPSLMDIMKESMILELNGLEVQLQFNGMNEDSGFGNAANSFLFHSTTFHDPNVLATSILLGDVTKSDIAHEFKDLEKEDFEEETDPMNSSMDSSTIFSDTKQEDTVGFNEGHTIISQAVERVISQLKAFVTNVTVRLEFPKPRTTAPIDTPVRIKKEQRLKNVLLLHFPRLEYLDETPKTESWPSKFTYSFIFKGIFLQVFEEYHSSGYKVDKDDESDFPSSSVKRDMNSSSDFTPTSNYIVNTQPSNTLDEGNTIFYGETENNKIKVNIRPSTNAMNGSIFGTPSPTFPIPNSSSKIDIEFDITSIHSVITPSQMDILLQIFETLNSRGINVGFDSFATSSKEEKEASPEFKSFKSDHSTDQIGTNAMLQSIEIPITTKMSETTLIKYQEKLERTKLHEEEVDSENFQFHTFESEPFSDESETEEHQIPEIRKPAGTPKKKTSPPIEKSPMKNVNHRFLTIPKATDTPAFGYNDINLSSSSVPCINFKIDIKLKAATFNLLYEDANLGTMWRTFFRSHDQNSGPDIPGIGHLSLRFVNGISCGVAFSTGGIVTNDNFSGIEQKNINKTDTTFHLTFGDVQLSERLCKESFGGRHIYSELKVLEFLNKPKDSSDPIIDYTYHFKKRENLVKHTLRINSQIQLSFDPGFLQRMNKVSSRLFSKSSLFTKISENANTSQYGAVNAFNENFEQAILDDLDKDQTQIGAPQRVAFDILTCGILIDILLPKEAENGETVFQSTHSYKPDRLRIDCKEIKVKASFREDGNQMLIDNELYQDRIQIDKNATIIPIIVGETNLILIEKKTGTSIVKIRPMKIFATIKPSDENHSMEEDVLYKSYISVPESVSSDFYDEVEHSSLDSSVEEFNGEDDEQDISEDKYIDPSQHEEDVDFSIDSIEDTIIGSKALEKSKISIIIDLAEKNSKSSDFSIEISREHFQKLNDFISKISQALSAVFDENQAHKKPSPKTIDSNPSVAIKFTSNNFTVRLLDTNMSRNCVLKFKKLNALLVMFSNWISKDNQKCTLINAYISNESITFYDEIANSRSYILRREDKLVKGFRQAKNCTNISVNVELYNKSISVQPKIFFSGLFLGSMFPTEENNWRKFLTQFFASDSKTEQKMILDIKTVLQDCALDYQPKDSGNRLILLVDKLGFHTHLNLPTPSKNTIYDINFEGMSLLLHNNFVHDIPKYLQEEIKNKRIPRSEFGFINELHYLCFVTIASLDKLNLKFTQRSVSVEESQASLIFASSTQVDLLGQSSIYKSKIVSKFALTDKEKEIFKHKEPITKLEISDGTLIVNLCKDSLSTLQDVIKQMTAQFATPSSSEQKVTEPENPIVIRYPSLEEIDNPVFTSSTPQNSVNIFEGVNDLQFGFSPKFTNSAVTEGEYALPNRKTNTRTLPSSNNSSASKLSREDSGKTLTPVKTEPQPTGLMSWVTSLMNDYLTEDDSKPQQIKPTITPGSTSYYPQTSSDDEDDDVIVTSIYKDGVGSSTMLGQKSTNTKTLLSSFIQEHTYFPTIKKEDLENDSRLPLDYPTPSFELVLSKCNILCHIFGGKDWADNSESDQMNTSQSSTTSSTFLQFGDLIQSTRDHTKLVQLNLNDLLLQYDTFPNSVANSNVSRLSFSITDIELLDKLKESNRNKILKYWETESEPRETDSKMISLLHEVIRQKGATNANEVRLDIDILPIRLNVHQSTMEFIIEFFTSNKDEIPTTLQNTTMEETKPTYFQQVHISPIQFKVDYQPVRVNLDAVKENGITSYKSVAQMVNLVPINGAEVKIKPIQLNGISGIEEVVSKSTALILDSIDTGDIFRALLGIMPIKSMYSIGTGVADLVVLPIQSYQTDGQVLRGLRRGLSSFVTNLSVGTVQLTSNAATGVNYVVQKTDQYVKQSSGLGKFINYDYVQDDDGDIRTVPNTPPPADEDLPTNINNAIQRAYRDISTGFEDAKLAVIAIPKSGNVWTIPRVVLSPLAGMTGAISNLMIGIRSEVDSSYRQENKDLYKK